jgi:hypothetical protein
MARADLLTAASRLLEYGYDLDVDGFIYTPSGRRTEVQIEVKGPRYRAVSKGQLLWSGGDVGDFVKRYWYGEKRPATQAHRDQALEAKRDVRGGHDLTNLERRERHTPDIDFSVRDRVDHVWITESDRGFHVRIDVGHVAPLMYDAGDAPDEPALRVLNTAFGSFDEAHDAAQAVFRYAMVGDAGYTSRRR